MSQEVIQFFGASAGEECGYCKQKRQEDYTNGKFVYACYNWHYNYYGTS